MVWREASREQAMVTGKLMSVLLLSRVYQWKVQASASKLGLPQPESGIDGVGIFVHIPRFLWSLRAPMQRLPPPGACCGHLVSRVLKLFLFLCDGVSS